MYATTEHDILCDIAHILSDSDCCKSNLHSSNHIELLRSSLSSSIL